MQLIEPHEAGQRPNFGLVDTRAASRGAVAVVAGRSRRVEVLGRLAVDVLQQAVDVKEVQRRQGPAELEELLEGYAVLEHGVDVGRVLLDLVAVLGHVVLGLGLPELAVAGAAVVRVGVERGQLQGRRVQQHEAPAAGLVDGVEDGPDAVDKVADGLAGRLRVGQEGVKAQVVGADPDRIHGVGGIAVGIQRLEGDIGLERGDLVVQDSGELPVHERGIPRHDLVGAYGTADGVVHQLGAGTEGGGLSPREAAAGGDVGHIVVLSRGRRLPTVADVVAQTAVVGVAVTKSDQGVETLWPSEGVSHGDRGAGEDQRGAHCGLSLEGSERAHLAQISGGGTEMLGDGTLYPGSWGVINGPIQPGPGYIAGRSGTEPRGKRAREGHGGAAT